MIEPNEPRRAAEAAGNGTSPAGNVPPLETLLYDAGLITADQLGELVRDSVVFRRPVGTVALERGLITPEAMQGLLAQAEAAVTPVDPTPAVPERVEETAEETWGHVSSAPLPDAPAARTEMLEPPAVTPPTLPAYALVLRLQNGERLIVDTAATFESAAELGRTLAARLAAAGEWPLVAGRFVRPEAIVSVDIERSLEA